MPSNGYQGILDAILQTKKKKPLEEEIAQLVRQRMGAPGPSLRGPMANTMGPEGERFDLPPERGLMSQGADPGSGQDPQMLAESMGARMRGIPGASGGGEGGGPSIAQIIGLALEGFASGAQGRAPQGPGLMMQAQAQKNQQDIAKRKLEMDEKEFGMKERQFGLQEEKFKSDKESDVWKQLKEVREYGITDPTAIEKITGKLAERYGDPEMKDAFKDALANDDYFNAVEKALPNMVKQYGARTVARMQADPGLRASLAAEEKGARHQGFRSYLSDLITKGTIKPGETTVGDLTPLLGEHARAASEMTAEHWEEMGINTPRMIAADKKDKAAQDRFDQAEARREREAADREARALRAEAQRDRHFQATFARLNENQDRIPPTEKRELDNLSNAYILTDKLQTLHAEAAKEQGGKFTSAFRNALLSSQKGNRFVNIAMTDGFTGAEKKLAAQFNTMYGALYTLTTERALTEQDAIRNLTSFMLGNAPDQVQLNLQSRKDQFRTAFEIRAQGALSQGRNITGYGQGVDKVGEQKPGAGSNIQAIPGPVPAGQDAKYKPWMAPDGKLHHVPRETTQEQLKIMSETYGKGGATKPPSSQATHRFNPATGKIEEIKK